MPVKRVGKKTEKCLMTFGIENWHSPLGPSPVLGWHPALAIYWLTVAGHICCYCVLWRDLYIQRIKKNFIIVKCQSRHWQKGKCAILQWL